MNIDRLFSNNSYLEKELMLFIKNKQVRKSTKNIELVNSHLEKAKHNMEFFKFNKRETKFNDWLIVALYYSLYHCALALITNKEYISKNHYATILLLIKEYNITEEEVNLLNELSISKKDAELYTDLKQYRHEASYSTDLNFNSNKIELYEFKVIEFINKTEEIIINK